MFAPTAPQYTTPFTDELEKLDIPYIYIDSNIKEAPALSFFGQNSHQSGYFAARMMMLLARDEKEIVIFRKIHEGIVGSNQQENREIGFRQYMEEHHPSCNILELDLHAERNDEDNEMLDEVVVVGYGVQKKSDVTGAMIRVGSEELNSRPVANAFEAMQGKDNTFYAGEVMAFGDMEETVEYSRDLVRRFFK